MKEVRNDCLNLISSILEEKRPSHLVISEYLGTSGLDAQDRSFVKKLVQGCVERKITLDYILDEVSRVKTNKMKPVIRNLLRMGAYQIVYMNVPDPAACNESVKIAKKRNLGNLSGFVNGVLRSVASQKEELTDFSGIKDINKRLSAEYSVPMWLVESLAHEYKYEAAERIFEYWLTDSKTSIRCNISKIDPEELVGRLRLSGISVERTSVAKCVRISGYSSLNEIPEFNAGLFTVQDESSVMSGEIADIKEDASVLDICAAPGGKSLNIADRMLAEFPDNPGTVTACDVSSQKTELILENVERCGFKNINILVNDATVYNKAFENSFDTVIADVPCSGIGIIGKKPDIKYNITPEGLKELVELQHAILDNAVRYVCRGGQLIFSTCTVNRSENQENVDYIKAKGFKCITSKQLLPGIEGTDGFFYAKFIKNEDCLL